MRGMGWECGCRESAWECGESGWKYEKCENQGGAAGNQGRSLSTAVEITQNSNGNDKLKDCREVKIINLVSPFQSDAFLANFLAYLAQGLSVFTINFKQVNTGWKD